MQCVCVCVRGNKIVKRKPSTNFRLHFLLLICHLSHCMISTIWKWERERRKILFDLINLKIIHVMGLLLHPFFPLGVTFTKWKMREKKKKRNLFLLLLFMLRHFLTLLPPTRKERKEKKIFILKASSQNNTKEVHGRGKKIF